MKLKVATCQFPVSADIRRNARYVRQQLRRARQQGAHLAHFGEGCLSGYAGVDFETFEGFDWTLLKQCAREVLKLARELGLWVLLGSSHPLSAGNKPHNSVYVINQLGEIVDRYDKLFCAGDPAGLTGDLAHYTPGEHFAIFTVRGVRCGVLICHDYRYPELYRKYKKRGVQLVFHSYHAGNLPADQLQTLRDYVGQENLRLNRGSTLPEITMPASMQAAAASSHVWISCSNTSARESCWPAFFVRPDGVITGRLRRNRAGILISTVDPEEQFYDSTVAWRDRAMEGVFHSGALVEDRRSRNRTEL